MIELHQNTQVLVMNARYAGSVDLRACKVLTCFYCTSRSAGSRIVAEGHVTDQRLREVAKKFGGWKRKRVVLEGKTRYIDVCPECQKLEEI